MKKIGLITFHRSKSYGATLQAYSTLKVLQNLGNEVEFVDYTNTFEQKTYKKKSNGLKAIISFIKYYMKRIILMDNYWNKKAFSSFEKIYGDYFSKIRTSNIKDLENMKYDILVVGSDQVWNPNITGGIDDAYLLNFGTADKRISYASSMGTYKMTESDSKIYQKCLNRFTSISVREKYAKDELTNCIDKDIEIVCDPTMLLNIEEWDKFIEKEKSYLDGEKRDYILTFFVGGTTDTYLDTIKYVKSKLGLPVYNIHINKHKRKEIDKVLAGVTVPQFVGLIKNASFIITDSFHGTVFSILYEKNFLAVSNQKNPIRVKELLDKLNLSNRLDNKYEIENNTIDYNQVKSELNKLKLNSLNWIKKALGDDIYEQH